VPVTSRLGRNTVVVELDPELEMIIDEKWAWFDEQAALKIKLIVAELNELKITKASQLGRLSRLIMT